MRTLTQTGPCAYDEVACAPVPQSEESCWMDEFRRIANEFRGNYAILETGLTAFSQEVRSNYTEMKRGLEEVQQGLEEVRQTLNDVTGSVSRLAQQQDLHRAAVGGQLVDMIDATRAMREGMDQAMDVLGRKFDEMETWRAAFESRSSDIEAIKSRLDAIERRAG